MGKLSQSESQVSQSVEKCYVKWPEKVHLYFWWPTWMIIRQSTLDNGQFLSIMINSKCDKANKNQPKQNLEHWWTSNVWHFYNLFGINPSEFQEFSRKYYENSVRPTILDMTHTQTVPQKIYCKFLRILKTNRERT